ncbi:MAG: electron transport complex subunit RsxD [Gammaproteobacteria bacterium]|nr:electron transport complex subunit RsxD [Gammaproteobacteria bacterium]NNM14021.1 electron transport complex subunit RsxD [Gammaproteobacteria bacterium]
MHFPTQSSPFIRPKNSVTKMMLHVLLALVPALIAYVWYFGWGIVINLGIATITALLCEFLALRLQNKPGLPALGDLSVVVTAILIAFCLPPLTAWYVTVIAVAFAVLLAKHVYGGLGYNIFNPAMAGYVVVLISFPQELTVWLPPRGVDLGLDSVSFGQTLSYVLSGSLPTPASLDAVTSATPLDLLKTDLGEMRTMSEIKTHPIFGSQGAHGWEWINNYIAIGGIYLMFMKVIRWHIPVAVLASLAVMAGMFNMFDPDHYAKAGFHIFSGAAILCAFFIATDPVTAATSNMGRIIYGIGIGVLIYVIRNWGGYPDAVAFAVLLMNMCVPLIDYYFKPRVYGHGKSKTKKAKS